MKRFHRVCVALVFGLLLGSAAGGCGGAGNTTALDSTGKQMLEEIGEMLKTVQADRTRPPARVAELGSVEPMLPVSAQALRSGEIVYFWGAGLSTGPNASSTVIAHEKKVPSEGGWALMQDGTVKQMTAEEFKAAPQAGK
jgi:hypothetical protein